MGRGFAARERSSDHCNVRDSANIGPMPTRAARHRSALSAGDLAIKLINLALQRAHGGPDVTVKPLGMQPGKLALDSGLALIPLRELRVSLASRRGER